MLTNKSTLAAVLVGAIIGSAGTWVFRGALPHSEESKASVEKQPLYWVAPMDPNYRRDEPGKSPMGMDLVPVYEDDETQGNSFGKGVIDVDPAVANSLGVRVAKARSRVLDPKIAAFALLEYDEDRLVHLHPRVAGWIEKLYVKAKGDPIEKGQPVYTLYAPELVNAQEEFLLAVSRQNNHLIDAAKGRLRALEFSEEAIKNLQASKQIQQQVTYFAPVDGVVTQLDVREGFYVQPATTLMSLGSLSTIWAEAELFEQQASQVAIGQPVTMTLDYFPDKQWLGEVNYIYPSIDSASRTLRIRLRFENADQQLRPGMYARIAIASEKQEAVVTVPESAVIRTGSQNRVVLALDNHRFKSVAVLTGNADDQGIAITKGLKAGDSVVTSAQFLMDSESSKTSDFERLDASTREEAIPHDSMDHDSMDHDSMDHDSMDHDSMDHDSMDHDSMDHDSMDHDSMDFDWLDDLREGE